MKPKAKVFSKAILRQLQQQAYDAKLDTLSLLSVGEAVSFWRSRGFVEMKGQALEEKIAIYGGEDRFMSRAVTPLR